MIEPGSALPRGWDRSRAYGCQRSTPAGRSRDGIGWVPTALLFGAAGVLLWLATRVGVPWVQRVSGCEPVVGWFLAGGLGFFLPVTLFGLWLWRNESRCLRSMPTAERLWCRRMTGADWAWGCGGIAAASVLGGASLVVLHLAYGPVTLHPPFLTMEPLTAGRWWILAAWVPFFLLNILGEEFVWHGVLLPRQQLALGRWAWLASGLGWLAMHVPFGWPILATLWPITIVVPYVVARRRNVWLGVLIHGVLNGCGFLAVALGWM